MKRIIRVCALVMAICVVLCITAYAQNELAFVNKTVSSYVYINQTECKNGDDVDVSASYYMYCRENNDCTHMSLKGSKTGRLNVDSGNGGKAHNLLVEWGDNVTFSYDYTIH